MTDYQQKLTELGNTAYEVACQLQRLKIRGIRGTARGCPIAKYLQVEGLKDAKVYGGGYEGDCVVETKLPIPIDNFVEEFDAGLHPALEEKVVL